LKAQRVVDHVRTVIAIELLCAAQALDFRRPLTSGPGVEAAHAVVRSEVAFMEEDRELHVDVAAVRRMLDDGRVLEAVRGAIGRG
jgi:histidine ammonia-lyase